MPIRTTLDLAAGRAGKTVAEVAANSSSNMAPSTGMTTYTISGKAPAPQGVPKLNIPPPRQPNSELMRRAFAGPSAAGPSNAFTDYPPVKPSGLYKYIDPTLLAMDMGVTVPSNRQSAQISYCGQVTWVGSSLNSGIEVTFTNLRNNVITKSTVLVSTQAGEQYIIGAWVDVASVTNARGEAIWQVVPRG